MKISQKTSNTPLLSVCCVAFNHEHFIKEAINSFLNQKTNFPFEIVIGEDCSSDNTKSICEEYSKQYPDTIKLLTSEANLGYASNTYRVFKACRGKYIAICDGDDYWTDPLKLQKQVDLLETNPGYSLCFHEVLDIRDDGSSSLHNNICTNKIFTVNDLTESNFIATSSCVLRNYNYELPKNFYTLTAVDWGLFFIAAQKGNLYYIKDCMSVYRLHSGGIWTKMSHNERMLAGVQVMLELDKASKYKYHNGFRKGIEKRLQKGDPFEIQKLLTNDKDLSEGLSKYIVDCPICGGIFSEFKPFGVNPRLNALCPNCDSLESHRLLWLFLKTKTNLFTDTLDVLDIAPTKGLSDKLRSLPNITYLSIDMNSPLAMRHMDITALDLTDNSFDCVICYHHVLEHIPDDRKAISEIFRILKPGGWVILQVPLNSKLEKNHEAAHITDPAERSRLFGQEDHVRTYGLDYKDKLLEAGFTVNIDNFASTLSESELQRYSVWKNEDICFCRKSEILNNSNLKNNKFLAVLINSIGHFKKKYYLDPFAKLRIIFKICSK